MNLHIIRQLNTINQHFYDQIADEFSQSRQHFWPGWTRLLPRIEPLQPISLLDIGCGNGRFAHFLAENGIEIAQYQGVDSNQQLLEHAQNKLKPYGFPKKFQQLDLVESLVTHEKIGQGRYSVISLLGVLHHIPSFDLRKKLFAHIFQQLDDKGLCIFTAWQFTKEANLIKRSIDPQKIGIDVNELGEGDYFLDWQKGKTAIRYCHLVNQTEVNQILGENNFKILETYNEDNSNTYYVCQKATVSSPK